jgi:hypothetical protein
VAVAEPEPEALAESPPLTVEDSDEVEQAGVDEPELSDQEK